MEPISPVSAFPQEERSAPPKRSRRSKTRLALVVLLIFLISVGFGLRRFIGGQETKKIVPTPVPTEEVFPTDTPIPQAGTPTPQLSTSPTPKPTSNPIDKATGLNRADLTVEVQNGGGQVGGASKGSDILKSFGYHVVSIGNADSFDYDQTVIKVKDEQKAFLPLLKKDVGTAYTITSATADLSASSSADALVIVGKQ